MTVMALVYGCGKGPNAEIEAPSPPTTFAVGPKNPEAALLEQLRSGSVQLAAAAETVQEALDKAKATKDAVVGAELEALLAAIDLIDSAGQGLALAAAEPPHEAQVAAAFAKWDDDRKTRIQAANDAYYELKEALGLIESQEPNYAGLAPVADIVSLAMKDVEDGIKALGGKIEVPSDEDE
jgi:hypothetical protein